MEPIKVTFALEDKSRGYEIDPSRIPIDDLIQFSKDVKDFIQGAEKEVAKDDLVVSIKKGSFALESPPLGSPKLLEDLKFLAGSFDISKLDAKRKKIVESWQKLSKTNTLKKINIDIPSLAKRIEISSSSNFSSPPMEHWVNVERYVRGELQDLGGVKNSNAHIRMSDGKSLTVKTDKASIRAQSANLVYHNVTVRIKARLNLVTGEIKEAELIDFIDYAPKFDEAQFELMTQKGRKAWSDIDDHAKWVRELRGSD